jgi:hypothetical protein
MKKDLRKMLGRTKEERFSQEPIDPAQLEPNSLRDKLYAALSNLSFEDRAVMRDRILGSLKDFGVNVSEGLLMLGIPARTADDLTPFDLAKLVRYLRINAPKAIEAISSQLKGLLAPDKVRENHIPPLRRAA